MAFVPRTFVEILDDMLAYVVANSRVNDVRVGSVLRTMLEAAALEDDEQYFQMVQLLDMFNIANAVGADLDRRLADYNLFREPAKSSNVRIRISDGTRIRSTLDQDLPAGSTVLPLSNTNLFPTSGYPYTIRVGEGTVQVENLTVTNNNTSTNQLSLLNPTNQFHGATELVLLTAGAPARTINTGTQVQVPSTPGSLPITFTTTEPGVIQAGNFRSNEIRARAVTPGPEGNVAVGRITRFAGSPPFTGALVTNVTTAEGGTSEERDGAFRVRALNQLQSLSRGTPVAVQSATLSVTDPATGQRVVSASLVEDFDTNEVIVYIDDGTGFTPSYVSFPSNSLSAPVSIGDTVLALADGSAFPQVGWVIIEADGVNDPEVVQYVNKPTPNSLALATPLVSAHTGGSIVRNIRILTNAAEPGQRRFKVNNTPVVRSSERVYVTDNVSPWRVLDRSEYFLNKGTGDLQILSTAGLTAGSRLVINYAYYTNLVQQVQRVLEGDLDDAVNLPGIKAAGINMAVETPVIRRVTVRLSISAEVGFAESDLRDLVRQNVEGYISSLGIGEDVIRSRIIDVAHDVQGVRSVTVIAPTNSVTILENELSVPFDASGNSLVTVF